MKSVGIVAEYNPLHYGHKYHIEESKKLAGADAVIVAMSGNYVQRGEPAILDKWERAKLAVINGVDVVFEIPTIFCLGNSFQYAKAAITLIESFGTVSHLSFGSESGDIIRLREIVNNLLVYNSEINDEIKRICKNQSVNFAKARKNAYENIVGEDPGEILNTPNDNLAISYLSAIKSIEPIAIKRKGAGYNDDISDCNFESASGIRRAIFNKENIDKYVPENVAKSLSDSVLTCPDLWLNYLKYAVSLMSADDIDNCPSGGEGLGNKIKNEIQIAMSWNDLILNVKSKKYTYTRISRLCMQILLGINQSDWINATPDYIRVLAVSKRGRELLSYIEKEKLHKLPIVTNINKQSENISNCGKNLLQFEENCTDIYNLITGRDQFVHNERRNKPFIQE